MSHVGHLTDTVGIQNKRGGSILGDRYYAVPCFHLSPAFPFYTFSKTSTSPASCTTLVLHSSHFQKYHFISSLHIHNGDPIKRLFHERAYYSYFLRN